MTDYLLTPPSLEESFTQYDRMTDPLWRYYRTQVAQSVVKIDGTWQVVRLSSYPGEVGLDVVYQGGHTYVVDQATADEMTADGLGSCLSIYTGDPYADTVLADEPYIYYRLADSGSVATDLSGAGRDGILTPNPVPGLVAGDDLATQALGSEFGDVPFGYAPGSDFITDITGWSLEVWVRGGGQIILAVQSGSIACVTAIVSEAPNSGDLSFLIRTQEDPLTSVYATASASTWNDGNAHHIVGTYDGSTMKLYFDGELVAATDVVGTLTADVLAAQQITQGTTTFDEAAFYTTALSPSRVQAHYDAGVA